MAAGARRSSVFVEFVCLSCIGCARSCAAPRWCDGRLTARTARSERSPIAVDLPYPWPYRSYATTLYVRYMRSALWRERGCGRVSPAARRRVCQYDNNPEKADAKVHLRTGTRSTRDPCAVAARTNHSPAHDNLFTNRSQRSQSAPPHHVWSPQRSVSVSAQARVCAFAPCPHYIRTRQPIRAHHAATQALPPVRACRGSDPCPRETLLRPRRTSRPHSR